MYVHVVKEVTSFGQLVDVAHTCTCMWCTHVHVVKEVTSFGQLVGVAHTCTCTLCK